MVGTVSEKGIATGTALRGVMLQQACASGTVQWHQNVGEKKVGAKNASRQKGLVPKRVGAEMLQGHQY